jgi:hypothetical protein
MAAPLPKNLRIPEDLNERIQKVRQKLQVEVPGATWTSTVLKILKRGLDALEADENQSA